VTRKRPGLRRPWKFRLNGLFYIWAAVWTIFPFVSAFILSATDETGFRVFIGWFGTLLTILILVCLIVLVGGDSSDSRSGFNRLAFYGFPPLARKFQVLFELGALALLGIVIPGVCFRFGYPPALTAALYAALAYGYLLQPDKPVGKQPVLKTAAPLPLPGERHWSSTPNATLVGLFIALLFPIPPYRQPFLHLLIVSTGLPWMTAWETIGIVFKITTVVAIFFIVKDWERRPVETIGWRKPRLTDVLLGVAAFVAMQGVVLVTWPLELRAIPSAAAEIRIGAALYGSLPLSLSLLGSICNATAEEIGFRGYALERLSEITGSTWLGAGIPYIVEVLCHAPI